MVSICTPNVTHFSIAMDTVKSGKAYVLEKPVAMTLAEAKELYLATKNTGLTNAVGFSYRYLPITPAFIFFIGAPLFLI